MTYFADDAGAGVLLRFDARHSERLDQALGIWVPSPLAEEAALGMRTEMSQITPDEAAKIAASLGGSLATS